MADFIPLEDAAKSLGVSIDELKDMRSRGEIFGFRDGTSWKFKEEEIERVRSELAGDVLDDDPGGSSILISERSVGAGSSKLGSTLGSGGGSDSDLRLDGDDDDDDSSDALSPGSDVALVADPSSQSGVRLVNRNAPVPADDDDEVLELPDDSESGSSLLISDLNLEGLSDSGASSTPGSGIAKGSDRDVLDSDVLAGVSASRSAAPSDAADLIHGDSDPDLDIKSSDDSDDDLVLGGDSGLSLKSESGIRLNSPSDSGISLEAEPIDLSGTGISGLGLGSDDFGSNPAGAAAGSGISGIDFASAEDFQLSPSSGLETDEDSGSQVIELEDSADFAAAPAGGFGAADVDAGFDQGEGIVGFEESEQSAPGYVASVPDTQFVGWQVAALVLTIVFLGLAGILVTDISRNMWAAADGSTGNLNSWLSEAIRSTFYGASAS